MDAKIKIFLLSTILNLIDLITTLIDLNMGYIELNHWMLVFHNKYLSALMGVVTFELILAVWYLVSRKYEIVRHGMLVWGLTKLYPIVNNVLLIISSF
jgi:hypothetical protein